MRFTTALKTLLRTGATYLRLLGQTVMSPATSKSRRPLPLEVEILGKGLRGFGKMK